MKKKSIFIGVAFVGVLSLSACGKTELQTVAEQVETELGGSLDENVTSYVTLDKKAAKEAMLDLSAVDINKTGTYAASVTYKEQTAAFEVVVKDTTAPEVTLVDKVIVAAGMPLHAKDVIAEVTELSGEVTAVFEKAEPETIEQSEGTEDLEATEQPENTEALVPETELMTETPETEESAETFMVGAVTCTDDTTVFGLVGTYDVFLTVADASGNKTEVKVSVIVGEAPEFSGIEDLTVMAGTERVDYLEGVTATDYKGAGITDQIVCDAATVKLDTVGTYEILYTVVDEEGFGAEQKASVTVTEKKSEKSSGKRTSEKKQANTGNAGAENNTGAVANAGNGIGSKANTGNADAGNNAGNVGNAGASSQASGNGGAPNNAANSGSAGTSSQPSGNTGAAGNSGNAGALSQPSGNAGNTNQNAGNAGNAGNTGGTDQNAGNAGNTGNTGNGGSTDNSGSTGAGNTGNAGSGDAGFSGTTQEEWGNMGFEEFIPQPGTGADDGTGLGGGSSTWH